MGRYDEYDEDDEILEDDEDEDEEDEDDQETVPHKPRSGMVYCLTGGTFLTTEIIGAMMHGSVLGVGAGILASAFVYLKGQDVLDMAQDLIPLPDPNKIHLPVLQGRSLKDCLCGTFPEEEDEQGETTPKTNKKGQPAHKTEPGAALPRRSPRFAKMQHLITPGKDILGFDGERFLDAKSFTQSVNMAIIGLPGAGKTSCLTFHVAQAVLRGAIVRGWDLHGDVAADLGSLFNIMEDVDDIIADCQWLQSERDRRLALRKKAKAGDRNANRQWNETRELFYVVDEFVVLMGRLKQRKAEREMVADTLLSLIAEGRKLNMRCIIAGQTMPAALFGDGGSSARDIISTRYAFRSRDEQARYFGIEQQAIEKLLPMISGKEAAGYAILDGGPLLHAILISIPLTTVKDIRTLLDGYEIEGEDEEDEEDGNVETQGSTGNRRGSEGVNVRKQRAEPLDDRRGNNVTPFPESPQNARKQAKTPIFDDGNAETQEPLPLPDGVTWSDLEQIQSAYEAGWHLRDIAPLVHMDGRKYRKLKAACEYLGIDPREKAL